jgi:hypothetical protein
VSASSKARNSFVRLEQSRMKDPIPLSGGRYRPEAHAVKEDLTVDAVLSSKIWLARVHI